MATIKQKSLKPATNVPYAEGILAYNGTGAAIAADKLVRIDGVNGAQLKIVLAAGDSAGTVKPAMFVTKHGIPDGKSGVILPWKIIDFDTSTFTAGDHVYAIDTDGDIGVSGSASVNRVVGICLNSATVANGGKVWLAPTAMMGVSAI